MNDERPALNMQQAGRLVEQGDPDWQAVVSRPINECREPLVDVRECGRRLVVSPAYWHQGLEHALPTCYLRESVLERLIAAAERLPTGWQLVVWNGWRPYELQKALYDRFSATLRAEHPHLDAAEHARKVRQFVAPPSQDARAPSPHLTGGSVDLTLCDANGELLDMGTGFDELSPLSRTAALEGTQPPSELGAAREHRRQLLAAMTHTGFTNLPSEWWHFDYGNQLWAWSRDEDAAFYGKTSPIPANDLETLGLRGSGK